MFVIMSNPSAIEMNKPSHIPTKRVIDVEPHCMRMETATHNENVDTIETHAMRLYININNKVTVKGSRI